MRKITLILYLLFLISISYCFENEYQFNKNNKEMIIKVVEQIYSRSDFETSISENFNENIAEVIIEEFAKYADYNVDKLTFGEFCALKNIGYLLESNNVDLGNFSDMYFEHPTVNISAFDFIETELVADGNNYRITKKDRIYEAYLNENREPVVLSFLTISAIGGIVGGAGNLISLGLDYGFDISEIPVSEIAGAFTDGFVVGFSATSLGILSGTILPVVGALPAAAAGLLSTIIGSPGFTIGLAEQVESFVEFILGPVADWSILDFYNPANYINLFVNQNSEVNADLLYGCNESISEFYEEYPNINLTELEVNGNAHLAQTWSFDGFEDSEIVKTFFGIDDYINIGMSLTILEG